MMNTTPEALPQQQLAAVVYTLPIPTVRNVNGWYWLLACGRSGETAGSISRLYIQLCMICTARGNEKRKSREHMPQL